MTHQKGNDWQRERNDDVRFDLGPAHPLALECRKFIRQIVASQDVGVAVFKLLEKEYGISFAYTVCVAASIEKLRLNYLRRMKAKPYDAFDPRLWWYTDLK